MIKPFQSDDITLLIPALINAKQAFQPIKKDRKGNRKDYSSIDAVLEAVVDALLNCGIVVEQPEAYNYETDKPYLITRLIHISGQWKGSISPLILDPDGPINSPNQQYGCALTYARRYALISLLALADNGDDIDNYDHSVRKPKSNVLSPKISGEKLTYLKSLPIDRQQKIKEFNKIGSIEDMTEHQYENMVNNSKK